MTHRLGMLGINYALLATTAVFRSQQKVEERSDALSCYTIIYIYIIIYIYNHIYISNHIYLYLIIYIYIYISNHIYIQKGTLAGPHFPTFLEMQCFFYILFCHLCSYTCYDITRDLHRLSDFLRSCQRMSRES